MGEVSFLKPAIKILVIVGPTASGKSELAVKLAKKNNGEIISADSRQIYKGMNLGTGKVAGKWQNNKSYVYKGIVHHCVDYVNPKKQYSAGLFKRDAQKAITDILERDRLPILCGGTGHWVDAVVYDQNLPDIKPNKKLRAALEKQSADVLFHRLLNLDPVRASTIDKFNKRRLIRALEIIITTGHPVPPLAVQYGSSLSRTISGNNFSIKSKTIAPTHNVLWLGIKTNQTDLYKKIEKRLKQRLKQGMIKEVKKLRADGLSWQRLESFGLEYRFVSLYLQKKISYEEMFTKLLYAIKHYSKRQLTWWKRNKEIKWMTPQIKPTDKLVNKFLNSIS